MASDKGKSKDGRSDKVHRAGDEENDGGATVSQQPSSLASRIASSASGLTRDAFGSGAATGATSGLASSLASSEKAPASSSASAAASSSASTWAQGGLAATTLPSSRRRVTGTAGESFRTASASQGEAGALDEQKRSFLEGQGSHVLSGSDAWVQEFHERGVEARDPVGTDRHALNDNSIHYTEHPEDGADVVALLSNPAFSLDDNLADDLAMTQHNEAATAEDLFGADALTPSEQSIAQQMRSSIPADNSTSPLAAQDPGRRLHQLSPNAEMLHESIAASPMIAGTAASSSSSVEQRGQWFRQWADQWEDVLGRYADEVWGAEQPGETGQIGTDRRKVDEAREAIRQTKEREDWWEDAAAVRRLKMVLGHLDAIGAGDDSDGQRTAESISKPTERSRAVPTFSGDGENIQCPDCGGMYGTDEHLARHQEWAARQGQSAKISKVELEFRRLQMALREPSISNVDIGR